MVDYIIVGAGSAGCILANRLSESPETSVLLIEAGGPDNKKEITIPAAYSTVFKTEMDWAYETEPQPYMNNRRLYWPRGKVLGGSSSINAMIYIRGHRQDYDNWADSGATGWQWDNVLPYFRKLEEHVQGNSDWYGTDGPMHVSAQITPNVMTAAFLEAARQAGFHANADFNGQQQDGYGLYHVTQKRGQRWSTARAYLKPVLKRPNLSTVTHALVTRILFEGRNAIGVEYLQEGTTHIVHANKEIILSGGTINSPQILLLSGVGPGEQLQQMGIEIIHDLPGVGQNLQDHIAAGIFHYASQPVSLASAESAVNVLKYLLFRKGPLTSNIAEGGMFIRSDPSLDRPDLQFLFGPIHYVDHGLTKFDGHGFGCGCLVLNPQSSGQITLKSRDPQAHPAIQPCYLSEQEDMEKMLYGIKLTQRIVEQPAFDPYRGERILPEPASIQSDDDWREYIRNKGETLYHPTGTCKMGQDRMAVVDPSLKVQGIDNLRVIDASVMPSVTSGNTNAPTMMIAEKGADLIKEA